MTSKFENQEVTEALDYCDSKYPDGRAYSETQSFQSPSNKILVAQNNTIIALLSSLHQKFDSLSPATENKTAEIDDIINKFKNLGTERKRANPLSNKFLVYKSLFKS